MIHSISIENFKIYRDKKVFDGLKNINILTGINGRGKSTFLQSLLLPTQSVIDNEWTKSLLLNGDYVHLGNANDVKNERASRIANIQFAYKTQEHDVTLNLSVPEDATSAQVLDLDKVLIDEKAHNAADTEFHWMIPNVDEYRNDEITTLFSSMHYVAAERKGPQLNYSTSKEKNRLDAAGEHCACVLYAHQNDAVDKVLVNSIGDFLPGISKDDLKDQTFNGIIELWMGRMFGQTRVRAEYIQSANVYVLNYTTEGNAKENKPTNIGFGYSYVLPILIAALFAKKNEVLIVENPEAHLHPHAQSILGKFIAWISIKSGVQIFIETHSEHIVNSFRVLIAQKSLSKDALNVVFFDNSFEDYSRIIPVDDNGKISYWPPRFFDQEEKDLDVIM